MKTSRHAAGYITDLLKWTLAALIVSLLVTISLLLEITTLEAIYRFPAPWSAISVHAV